MKKKHEINDRIIELMNDRNIDEVALANLTGKDKSTFYRITKKETVPTKTTIEIIAKALESDYYYLLTGKMQQNATAKQEQNPWKDEAYVILNKEIEYLKKKYDQLLEAYLGGNLGKLKSFGYAGLILNQPEVRVN